MKEKGKNMALINCPECGKQISELAKECPHCGNHVADFLKQILKI